MAPEPAAPKRPSDHMKRLWSIRTAFRGCAQGPRRLARDRHIEDQKMQALTVSWMVFACRFIKMIFANSPVF